MSCDDFAKAWMGQWRHASVALADQRIRELRAMTDDDARAATLALFDFAASMPIPPEREKTSGLVAQQALFHPKRPRA